VVLRHKLKNVSILSWSWEGFAFLRFVNTAKLAGGQSLDHLILTIRH